MRVFQFKFYRLFMLFSVLALAPLFGLAQGGEDCAQVVQTALQKLAASCEGLGRNSACYGYDSLNSEFYDTGDGAEFLTPGDQLSTLDLIQLEAAPLDVSTSEWGVALLNVQADVPEALPGGGLHFVLFGDAVLKNIVAPEDVLPPVTPISVTTRAAANLRSAPGTNTDVIRSVRAGSTFSADTLSEGRSWLRVLDNDRTVWVSRDAVNAEGDLDTLPAISSRNRTPLHDFRLSTRIGSLACNEAPALLVIQGPAGVQANIRVNGADIIIDATIVLRLLTGNFMEMAVLEGGARVGNVGVPHGFKAKVALSADGGSLAGPWTDFAPISGLDRVQFATLEQIPASLLHKAIQLPSESEVEAMLAEFSATSQGNASGQANCRNFRLTSPLQGLPPAGPITFFWDPALGATSYRVDVFNESDTLVGSYATTNAIESINADVGALGAGAFFTIEVTALVNGQDACSTVPVTLPREAICNQNNKCEPWLGEEASNCGDCEEDGD